MSDDNVGSKALIEATKAIAKDAYADGAKPAVTAIGETAGSVIRFVLRPIKLIADTGNAAFDKLEAALGARLKKIPPERLQLPPATIAAPAAMQYLLLGDGEDVAQLREMFENLLLASMDKQIAPTVHPAFVGMISQMTTDEAWILKSAGEFDYAAVDVTVDAPHGRRSIALRTLLGDGAIKDDNLRERCISNLNRLGILRIDWARSASDQREYEALEERVGAEFAGMDTSAHAGVIEVTPLGIHFIKTCVIP